MKKTIMWLIIAMIALLAACQEDEAETDEQEERVVAVETAEVKEEAFVIEHSVHGRATPNEITPVMLPASGELVELDVSNGDTVKKGDRIAVLSSVQGGRINITTGGSGQVANLAASKGAMVMSGQLLASVIKTDKMQLQLAVSANERDRFAAGEKYTVVEGDKKFDATVTLIDSMPGETGLYAVEAKVENPDDEILPGTVLEMIVPETVMKEALIVPTEAVIYEDNQSFVYVIEEDTAKLREVEVKEKTSALTAVAGEIEAGDQVVISGQLTLADGDTVDTGEGE